MKQSLKTILQFLLIWGAEMTVAWLVLHHLFPLSPKKLGDSANSLLSHQAKATLAELAIVEKIEVDSHPFKLPSLQLFMTGTSQSEILENLGEPEWRRPGYWDNSVAWFYENMLSAGIDLGFLFDRQTQKLRQAEIAFPPTIELEYINEVLDSLVDYTPVEVERRLAAVYWGKSTTQKFEIDHWEAVIQRNGQNRIYIGVWEKDFH